MILGSFDPPATSEATWGTKEATHSREATRIGSREPKGAILGELPRALAQALISISTPSDQQARREAPALLPLATYIYGRSVRFGARDTATLVCRDEATRTGAVDALLNSSKHRELFAGVSEF